MLNGVVIGFGANMHPEKRVPAATKATRDLNMNELIIDKWVIRNWELSNREYQLNPVVFDIL